ncbi:MAG: S1 RNA-binding domain-containing protein [Candidatus Aquicultorales bacterium]
MVKTTNFGAFIELEGGKTGLIHISEISHSYVKDVKDHLHENDMVRVKVVSMKPDGKIDLSMKQLEEPPVQEERVRNIRHKSDPNFERMMKQFMRSSEEKHADIKRNREAKRA